MREETSPIRVEQYVTREGKLPFKIWLDDLTDRSAKQAIIKRLFRLEAGNLGDYKFFDEILELRIDYGPGYRIYCGKKGNSFILLLIGGTKRSQKEDIRIAKAYWKEYQTRVPRQ